MMKIMCNGDDIIYGNHMYHNTIFGLKMHILSTAHQYIMT